MFSCKRCEQCFDRKYDYIRHLDKKIPCKIKYSSVLKRSEEFRCLFCQKFYSKKSNLKRHIATNQICQMKREHIEKEKELKQKLNEREEKEKELIQRLNELSHQNVSVTQISKRKVNGHTKRIVAHSQDWKCKFCESKLPAKFETDHIVPLFQGGTNGLENLQALCNNCHGDKTIIEQMNA